MSYSDELFDKQSGLAHAIMDCDDPTEIKELFDEFFFYAFQWSELFVSPKAINKLEAIHAVFSSFLEASGFADEAFIQGVRSPPTIESVARDFRFFPQLKTYCEEHFLNGGVTGALKYGESYSFGHDVVIPALSLITE